MDLVKAGSGLPSLWWNEVGTVQVAKNKITERKKILQQEIQPGSLHLEETPPFCLNSNSTTWLGRSEEAL